MGIFKIVGGKKVRTRKIEDGTNVVYVWDCKKPLYKTNDIKKAFNMFDRLCEEAYRNDMFLIADFSVMTLGQSIKCNMKQNVRMCDNNINYVTPYIALGEWHKDNDNFNGYIEPELYLYNGSYERRFDTAYETFNSFMNRYDNDFVAVYLVEYTKCDDRMFRKVRKVIDSNLMKHESIGHRYGCKKIKVDRFFELNNVDYLDLE